MSANPRLSPQGEAPAVLFSVTEGHVVQTTLLAVLGRVFLDLDVMMFFLWHGLVPVRMGVFISTHGFSRYSASFPPVSRGILGYVAGIILDPPVLPSMSRGIIGDVCGFLKASNRLRRFLSDDRLTG